MAQGSRRTEQRGWAGAAEDMANDAAQNANAAESYVFSGLPAQS